MHAPFHLINVGKCRVFLFFFFFQKNKNKSEKKADQLDFANSFTDLKENWQFQFTLVLYTFEN